MTLAISLSNATQSTTEFFSNINWAQPSWDLFIILFFVVAGFLYGLSLGRDRIIVILVAVYMALAVVNDAPYIGRLVEEAGLQQLFVVRISTFMTVFIILFFLLSRSALLKTIAGADTAGAWWQVLVFSFLHVGLLTSVTLSFLPDGAANALSPFTRNIFTTEGGKFFWVVAPIVAMIVLKGGAGEKKKYKYEI